MNENLSSDPLSELHVERKRNWNEITSLIISAASLVVAVVALLVSIKSCNTSATSELQALSLKIDTSQLNTLLTGVQQSNIMLLQGYQSNQKHDTLIARVTTGNDTASQSLLMLRSLRKIEKTQLDLLEFERKSRFENSKSIYLDLAYDFDTRAGNCLEYFTGSKLINKDEPLTAETHKELLDTINNYLHIMQSLYRNEYCKTLFKVQSIDSAFIQCLKDLQRGTQYDEGSTYINGAQLHIAISSYQNYFSTEQSDADVESTIRELGSITHGRSPTPHK